MEFPTDISREHFVAETRDEWFATVVAERAVRTKEKRRIVPSESVDESSPRCSPSLLYTRPSASRESE